MSTTPPGSEGGTEARFATDAQSLGDVLAMYEKDGFTGQFGVREGGRIVCFSCHKEAPAEEFHLMALSRTEGASDPDDMLAIAALKCPDCDCAGTLIMNYGPESTPEEAEVLQKLEAVDKSRQNPT